MKRDFVFSIKLSKDERAKLEMAAKDARLASSTFARQVLLELIEDINNSESREVRDG